MSKGKKKWEELNAQIIGLRNTSRGVEERGEEPLNLFLAEGRVEERLGEKVRKKSTH